MALFGGSILGIRKIITQKAVRLFLGKDNSNM